MSRLLFEIERYRGEGAAADLFYEAKVTEAVALTVDAWKQRGCQRELPLSAEDAQSLQNTVATSSATAPPASRWSGSRPSPA